MCKDAVKAEILQCWTHREEKGSDGTDIKQLMMGERRRSSHVQDSSLCFINRLEKSLKEKQRRKQNKEGLGSVF